jgi:hypothetical protein
MKRFIVVGGLMTVWLLMSAPSVFAQQRPPVQPIQPVRPTVSPALSPYLNLLRGGNPATNFYLGVVPEQQRRSNEALFGRTINQVLPRVDNLQARPSVEEEIARIAAPSVPAGFNTRPPANLFSRSVPGFGSPLPMPPAMFPVPNKGR